MSHNNSVGSLDLLYRRAKCEVEVPGRFERSGLRRRHIPIKTTGAVNEITDVVLTRPDGVARRHSYHFGNVAVGGLRIISDWMTASRLFSASLYGGYPDDVGDHALVDMLFDPTAPDGSYEYSEAGVLSGMLRSSVPYGLMIKSSARKKTPTNPVHSILGLGGAEALTYCGSDRRLVIVEAEHFATQLADGRRFRYHELRRQSHPDHFEVVQMTEQQVRIAGQQLPLAYPVGVAVKEFVHG